MKKFLPRVVFITCALCAANQIYGSQEDGEVKIRIEKGRFIPSNIEISTDTKVKLVIENLDDTPEEFESYDLNREVLINPLSTASFYIGPLSPGLYKFEGEFSPETAQGIVRVK